MVIHVHVLIYKMSTQYWVYGYTCTCTNMKDEYSILGIWLYMYMY